ncbi:uncharacterized protein LOC121975824 [Zingiber officinale]|uniref:uncharacterized protein LOC121975824 n=1 Tax=Zingiber officinale TaxID=94328 RepID=UPI001C4C0EC0|nr:uncharacterized protein LOC121975824 [Zingiber officinale]XP_042383643.1 uncharacterized protein LOC121975824 [Zingiber officinale]
MPKKRKAAKRKKKMAAAATADVAPNDHGHHDDGVLPPPEEIKEHDGGSTASSSSASSSPREHHCSSSAEEFPGSEPVAFNGSTEGVVLVEHDLVEEDSSIVVEETTFSSTTEFFAKSEASLVETTKYDKEDEGSVVPVEKIAVFAEEERQGDEIALAEVQVKVVLLTDVHETVEEQLDESHGDHCFGGKAEVLPTIELTPSPPVVVRPTTWWTCCGLLDVFAGSGR